MNSNALHNPEIRLAEDRVPRYLLLIVLAVVLITLAGIAWAWLLWRDVTLRLGGLPEPTQTRAPRDIAGVNQTLILLERHGQQLHLRQDQSLTEFGWVDEAQGIVRIPIDEAIRLKARGAGR